MQSSNKIYNTTDLNSKIEIFNKLFTFVENFDKER